jgi:hypothetical protein
MTMIQTEITINNTIIQSNDGGAGPSQTRADAVAGSLSFCRFDASEVYFNASFTMLTTGQQDSYVANEGQRPCI